MRIFLAVLVFLSGMMAMAEKVSANEYTVLNNNRKITYSVVKSEGNSYALVSGKMLSSSGNILVAFKKAPDIVGFESRYSVKLVKEGHIWDVFKNNSSLNDLALASKIAADMNDSIKTVTPDWVMNVSPR